MTMKTSKNKQFKIKFMTKLSGEYDNPFIARVNKTLTQMAIDGIEVKDVKIVYNSTIRAIIVYETELDQFDSKAHSKEDIENWKYRIKKEGDLILSGYLKWFSPDLVSSCKALIDAWTLEHKEDLEDRKD